MKKLLAVRLVTLALFTNQATSAESQFDALVQKKYPIITIFVQGVEQTYQINALKTQDPKVILNELKRLTDTFGDLPLALVVSPETTVSQLHEWILLCHMSNANTIRVYLSSHMNWKSNQPFDKTRWFDVNYNRE